MRETITAISSDGTQTRYLLEVIEEGDHWVSTLARLSDRGIPEPARVAPRFYGTTADQARRRTITALENQYDEVRVGQ